MRLSPYPLGSFWPCNVTAVTILVRYVTFLSVLLRNATLGGEVTLGYFTMSLWEKAQYRTGYLPMSRALLSQCS